MDLRFKPRPTLKRDYKGRKVRATVEIPSGWGVNLQNNSVPMRGDVAALAA